MPTYLRPGVYTEESLRAFTAVEPGLTSSSAAFLGEAVRGPLTPTAVESWTQFTRLFGDFVVGAANHLHHAVYQFFANGGRRCYVLRVTGVDPDEAYRTVNDNAGVPLPTLRVSAISPGTWGNDLYFEISEGATAADEFFDLTVYYGGTTSAFMVERWTDLTMNDIDYRYAVNVVNNDVTGSQFIRLTDLASTTPAPGDRPAATGIVSVAGSGGDGQAGDNGAAVATVDYSAALPSLDELQDLLVLNVPANGGLGTDTAVATEVINYAEARQDVFVVVDPSNGDTVSQVQTFYGALPKSSYAALYYPWIQVADVSMSAPGATRYVAPGGAVLGQIAMTDALRGVHKAPAGIGTAIPTALDVQTRLTNQQLDTLNAGMINVIRNIPGAGICIMGARTLLTGRIDKYIPARRTLIYVRRNVTALTQFAVFEPNDPDLWEQINMTVESFLNGLWQEGGLKGANPEEAYYVRCDAELNNDSVVAQGQVVVEVGLALQTPAEFVVIRIGQMQATAPTSVVSDGE